MVKKLLIFIFGFMFLSYTDSNVKKISTMYFLRIHTGYNDSIIYFIDFAFESNNSSEIEKSINYLKSIKDTINIDSIIGSPKMNFFFKYIEHGGFYQKNNENPDSFDKFYQEYRLKRTNFSDESKINYNFKSKIKFWKLHGDFLKLSKNYGYSFFYRRYGNLMDSSFLKLKVPYLVKNIGIKEKVVNFCVFQKFIYPMEGLYIEDKLDSLQVLYQKEFKDEKKWKKVIYSKSLEKKEKFLAR